MAANGAFPISVASFVENVLQHHESGSRSLDFDARRAEEAAMRRYEAAAWLRKMVGVVGAKDLPGEPSEEELRLGLRSGIILCNVLNKIQPGVVPKVVENPCDASLLPDGAALSAYQYFENVRNFLVAVQELGIPTFEASDLEQGGTSSRIVNCVLGLKSYSEWKRSGGIGVWKFGGNVKPTTCLKQISRKNLDPFMSSSSRTINEKPVNGEGTETETETNRTPDSSWSMLVRSVLLDKKPEEVPNLIESVLNKVVEEFDLRIASQIETQRRATLKDSVVSHVQKPVSKQPSGNTKVEQRKTTIMKKEDFLKNNNIIDKEHQRRCLKHQIIVNQQQECLKELKRALSSTKAGVQFMQIKFHEEIKNIGLHIHGLAHAASGYHRVLEENLKLYNQVQDLKGTIRVYCRVRPFLPGQSSYMSSAIDQIEDGMITINTPSRHGKGQRSFNFNKVFGPSVTQGEVFSDTQPLIRSVLDGYNVCIFAYGQTGSGKTYTMTGPIELTEQTQGVNYRALSDLFLLAEQRKDTFHYDVFVQMIEIYNEQVRDLLGSDGLNKRLEIRRCSQGLTVPDASVARVTSTLDVIDLMKIGQRNRSVGETALNDHSSRSHSCLTVHVHGQDLTTGTVLRGCMHLVDLAGSERVDKSQVTGDRLREAQHINKSLSALGDVISALVQKNAHVPYRNSKLTQLLQDSLGGHAKTLMFVHISPEADAVGETISTLKFAERVAGVELGAARVNKDYTDVKELKEQIASLKAALAKKEAEPISTQHKLHSSPHNRKPSACPDNLLNGNERLKISSPHRKLIGEVDHIEGNKSKLMEKRQSFDLDELLGNPPLWSSVSSPSEKSYRGDNNNKQHGSSGDWVDKVMVNKQESLQRMESAFGGWQSDDVFYQKYLTDPFKPLPRKTCNQFGFTTTDDLDELDAATSDSSEPDLLWQFNHSKFGNGVGSTTPPRLIMKPMKSPQQQPRTTTSNKTAPSPSRKPGSGVARHSMLAEVNRKTGKRK
ncbi:unnamed protein product [Cuscuta europaea]|uniref:Kinesin-like protein KIN-14I n=1 Tax=Cuscuta europaea TaxID=41803 RepID=A0A9P0YY56_CUSEU|nr:unnamed protein product [Cuscuta europaea]